MERRYTKAYVKSYDIPFDWLILLDLVKSYQM